LTIVEELSARPNTVFFAGIRSFPLAQEHPLSQLAAKLPNVVIPIKLTSGNREDNQAAAELIKGKVGKVDVIIANAGD
jgi:norsolorinic acid ketoreductase